MTLKLATIGVSVAEQINEAHRLARSHADSAVQHAIRCGELLLRKKAELKHGEFQAWVEANCEFTYRSAAGYMKIAQQKCNALHFSSLREALGYNDRKPDPPQQPQLHQEPAAAPAPVAPPPAVSLASGDLSHIGPPLTDEDRQVIAAAQQRVVDMLKDFAARRASSEKTAAELAERFPPGPDTSKQDSLGVDVLARLESTINAIERAGVTPRFIPEHRIRFSAAIQRLIALNEEIQ